eukprot:437676-Pyramimonas_sp.AAC.1
MFNDVGCARESGACCFDIKSALPSFHAQWFEHVLAEICALELYRTARVKLDQNVMPQRAPIAKLKDGVKQGCPLSGAPVGVF